MLGLKVPTSNEQDTLFIAACNNDRVITIDQCCKELNVSEREAKRNLDSLIVLGFLTVARLPRTRMNLNNHKLETIGGFTNGYQVTPDGIAEIARIRNICERGLRVRRDNFRAGDHESAARWMR